MEKTWRKSRERLTKRPDLISRSLAGGFCIGHARMSIASVVAALCIGITTRYPRACAQAHFSSVVARSRLPQLGPGNFLLPRAMGS